MSLFISRLHILKLGLLLNLILLEESADEVPHPTQFILELKQYHVNFCAVSVQKQIVLLSVVVMLSVLLPGCEWD